MAGGLANLSIALPYPHSNPTQATIESNQKRAHGGRTAQLILISNLMDIESRSLASKTPARSGL